MINGASRAISPIENSASVGVGHIEILDDSQAESGIPTAIRCDSPQLPSDRNWNAQPRLGQLRPSQVRSCKHVVYVDPEAFERGGQRVESLHSAGRGGVGGGNRHARESILGDPGRQSSGVATARNGRFGQALADPDIRLHACPDWTEFQASGDKRRPGLWRILLERAHRRN